jgi:hypothetical protein
MLCRMNNFASKWDFILNVMTVQFKPDSTRRIGLTNLRGLQMIASLSDHASVDMCLCFCAYGIRELVLSISAPCCSSNQVLQCITSISSSPRHIYVARVLLYSYRAPCQIVPNSAWLHNLRETSRHSSCRITISIITPFSQCCCGYLKKPIY